ncbi:vWA domain-containing protein [Flagellimonas crocea]|uniref:vWA domain-containing protein n=1 Tax=Flagellimonas crocea TaxID=3067311 RepID=UPI00296E8E35|nr:von Willebrand factor type A domain-containing protein [Muricauda sp. DH64]
MKNAILLIVLAFCVQITAQENVVTGVVTDADNYPIPGANVLVKGTSKGAQTNFDGQYSIAAYQGQTLVFSYIGYKTEEVKVGLSKTVNVQMEEDVQMLEEVVTIGYAAQGYSTRAPSAAQIKRRKQKAYHTSIAQTLQGRAAGVQVVGNADNIRIRGVNSIKSGEEPLYIVDGTPILKQNNSVVAQLDPSQIDKINIYKGAKARSLFGSSAKNGCIVITTKKGNYQIQNDEKYAEITENQFEHVSLSPLSTFSIDVDKASYSNIRRMINNGQQIPADAVKVEEMINYFNYSYPQPTEHPFSINTEVVQTPWNKDTRLVRIGLQGKTYEQKELPASNLTFLIDVSGSMGSQNKLPLLKSAFKLLVNQLREKDKVSIVVYAGAAGVVLEPTRGDKKMEIIKALDNLNAGGSTAGGEGIDLAYKLASKNFIKNGNNRVILATDGDFNVGPSSDKDMVNLIEEKRKSGVFLSVLGFGMGNYKDSKMEKLADKGNGNHAYIDTMQEAQKVFGQEFGGTLYTIAKDVKIQVEFNPAVVSAYRLIGYENRMLADEDFIDDTKDAGELGSGHTVTALYEVVPVGVESPFLKPVHDLKYADTKNTGQADEFLTVKFRYKKPDGDTSTEITKIMGNSMDSISPDFNFAASVALFGLHLRKSKFTNNSTLDQVVALAEKGLENDSEGYRAEFVRLVKSYANSL